MPMGRRNLAIPRDVLLGAGGAGTTPVHAGTRRRSPNRNAVRGGAGRRRNRNRRKRRRSGDGSKKKRIKRRKNVRRQQKRSAS